MLILELSLCLADEPQTKARRLFSLEPQVQNRNKAAPDASQGETVYRSH